MSGADDAAKLKRNQVRVASDLDEILALDGSGRKITDVFFQKAALHARALRGPFARVVPCLG